VSYAGSLQNFLMKTKAIWVLILAGNKVPAHLVSRQDDRLGFGLTTSFLGAFLTSVGSSVPISSLFVVTGLLWCALLMAFDSACLRCKIKKNRVMVLTLCYSEKSHGPVGIWGLLLRKIGSWCGLSVAQRIAMAHGYLGVLVSSEGVHCSLSEGFCWFLHCRKSCLSCFQSGGFLLPIWGFCCQSGDFVANLGVICTAV